MDELLMFNKPSFLIEMEAFIQAISEQDFTKANKIRKSMGDDFELMWNYLEIAQKCGVLSPPKSKGENNGQAKN